MSNAFATPGFLDQAATDNPQLADQAPGSFLAAAQSAAPDLAIPATSQALQLQAAGQAVQQHAQQNDSHGFWGGLLHVGSTLLDWANKPLQEIQKDYKFLHAVYTQHGFLAGLGATAMVAGGTALGALAGPEGAVLAADATAALERQIFGHTVWKDSYAASNDANYKVSFGRDLANLLGAGGTTDSGWGRLVSGAGDAAFDLELDPLRGAGKADAVIRQGKYVADLEDTSKAALTGDNLAPLLRQPAAQQFLQRYSLRVQSPDQIEAASHTARVNRAFQQLADETDPGQIIAKFPELREGGGAADLAKITTVDGVKRYFQEPFWQSEVLNRTAGPAVLPSRTIMRAAGGKVADWATTGYLNPAKVQAADEASGNVNAFGVSNRLEQRGMLANQANLIFPRLKGTTATGSKSFADWAIGQGPKAQNSAVGSLLQFGPGYRQRVADAWGGAIAKKARTFSGYEAYGMGALEPMSNQSFDLMNPTDLEGVRRMFRYGMGQRMANKMVGLMADAQKRAITHDPELGPILSTDGVGAIKNLYLSGVVEMLKAAGIPDDETLLKRVMTRLKVAGNDALEDDYGRDADGMPRSTVEREDGSTAQEAIDSWQANTQASFVDFRELKSAMRDMGVASSAYGKVDDFLAKHYTNAFFKPLALLTGGFGLRIAMSEMIPGFMRNGVVNTLRDRVIVAAAKQKYKLLTGEGALDEASHVVPAAHMATLGHEDFEQALADQPKTAVDAARMAANPSNFGITDQVRAQAALAADAARQRSVPVLTRLAKAIDPEAFDLAVKLTLANGGHIANRTVLTGAGFDADMQERYNQYVHNAYQEYAAGAAKKGRVPRFTETGKYRGYSAKDSQFKVMWVRQLQRKSQNLPNQLIAKDVLDGINGGMSADEAWEQAIRVERARQAGRQYDPNSPEGFGRKLPRSRDSYRAERATLLRYHDQSPLESPQFASDRVNTLRGLVQGQDGTFHEGLLAKISNGEKPRVDDVEDVEPVQSPWTVPGPELQQYIGGNIANRIVQQGYAHVIDPIVNGLSRDPLYFAAFKQEYQSLKPMIASGGLTDDQAVYVAQQRATHVMLPQIHNTHLRTQFGRLAENYMPFYFAQEQAIKRSLTLIRDNPAALRQYQMIYEGMNNTGFVQNDGQGNKYLILPGVGAIGNAVMALSGQLGFDTVGGLPISVQGNMSSLRTVIPEAQLPGVSPLVSIALNEATRFDPSLQGLVEKAEGPVGANQDMLDILIPNSPLRNMLRAVMAQDSDSSFANAEMSALASAYYHGQVPSPAEWANPQVKQAFLDRIKNNARSIMITKAIIGTFSPLAPQVSQDDLGLIAEFNQLKNQKGNYLDALDEFIKTHGDSSISYTVSKSNGLNVPYTAAAIQWIEQNQDLIHGNNATGAAFLVPQAGQGGDIQAVYDELLKENLRSKDTPEEFMNAVYVAAGNNSIYKAAKVHQDALATMVNDSQATAVEKANWSQYVANFGQMNPIWWDDYSSSAKSHTAVTALADLQTLYRNGIPAGAQSQQSELVAGLLGDFNQHQLAVSALQQAGTGGVTAERANWRNYLLQLEQDQPLLAPVIRSVFLRLATVSDTLPTAAQPPQIVNVTA